MLRFRMVVDVTAGKDTCQFYLYPAKNPDPLEQPFGPEYKLYFHLDHLTGARAGLATYAAKATGGQATFSDFRHSRIEESQT